MAFTRTCIDLVETTLNFCHCLLFMKVRVVGFGDSSALGVAVRVMVEVFVGVGVTVGEDVAVAVGVNVAVAVGDGVPVAVDVGVGVGVGIARSVRVTLRDAPRGKGFVDDVLNSNSWLWFFLERHCESVLRDALILENVVRRISRLTKSEGFRQRVSSSLTLLSDRSHLMESTM